MPCRKDCTALSIDPVENFPGASCRAGTSPAAGMLHAEPPRRDAPDGPKTAWYHSSHLCADLDDVGAPPGREHTVTCGRKKNRRTSGKRTSSMSHLDRLMDGKPEHLMLARPLGWHTGEAGDADAARKPPL